MDLEYGTYSYDRQRGNFPVMPVINMFLENVPEEPSPSLVSRPGLTLSNSPNIDFTYGINPHGMFYIDGILSNQWFVVTTQPNLYKGNPSTGWTSVGTLDGSGPTSWGAYSNWLFVTNGTSTWKYDGTTLSSISMPGGFNTTALCIGGSRLIVIDAGTGQFFWSDPLGTTVPALNFATAENSPDKLLDCLYIGDALYLFGTETVEIWPVTTDLNLPFQPLIGRTMNTGIKKTGCATQFNFLPTWINNHNNVCMGNAKTIISHPGIEEKIALSTNILLWNFWLEGTEFLAVRLDNNTFVYSAKSQQWSEFSTAGASNWYAACYANGFFGSGYSGISNTFRWLAETDSSGAYAGDAGTSTFERRFRCGMPLTTGNIIVNNLTLRVNEGYTPLYSVGKPTEFQHPTVNLSFSRDGGNSWITAPTRSLGVNRQYSPFPEWRSLGMFSAPGFLAEVKITDRVPFRISGAKINEAYPSR